MKICILAPEFFPSWGGVGTHIFELARHLPKNMQVHIMTVFNTNLGKNPTHAYKACFSKYFGSNVHVHFLCNSSDTFFYNAHFQLACARFIPNLVKTNGIELLISHTAHMPDLLLNLKDIGVPIITTVHTTIKSQRMGTNMSKSNLSGMETSEKATFLLYPFLRFAENVYLKNRKYLITPSLWMKKWLESNYSLNAYAKVIHNFIDLSNFEKDGYKELSGVLTEKLQGRRIILYSGRLLAMKGVNVLLDAVPEIISKYGKGDLLFVFAGPGDRRSYVDTAKKLGIASNCLFTGSIDREKIKQLMKLSEFVVVPSFLENMPYTILESMACGTPVIASNTGGIPEMIENGSNGLLFPVGSKEKIISSSLTLLENINIRNKMGERAHKTVAEKFSWSAANINKYTQYYSDVINNRL